MGLLLHVRLLFLYLVGIFWFLLAQIQIVRLIVTKRGKFFYKKDRKVPPACLSDPVYGRHCTAKLKDVTIHYVESGPPEAPLMLMVHGFPEFWYSWRHQIKYFNKTYRVVAIDLRGYGGSSKPSSVSEYVIDKLADDVAQLIVHLGARQCTLFGHDWGGAITWNLLVRRPDLIEKAVIMNCPHVGAFMKTITKSWKQFMKSWYMFLVNLPYFPEWFFSTGDLKMLDNAFCGRGMGAQKGAFSKDDMEAFKYSFNTSRDFTGPMNYIRAAIRGLNRIDRRKVENTPVMVLWGTKDGALTNEMAELSGEYATDFTLHFIEGASHWVQQDMPDLVNKHISQFL